MLEFDHIVLTVRDLERTLAFYGVLGMEARRRPDGRYALHFHGQKLNLHRVGDDIALVAAAPAAGTADFCLRLHERVDAVVARLREAGFPVLTGPVERIGARCPLRSFYLRDPDGNLVELANEVPAGGQATAVDARSLAPEKPDSGVEVRSLWSGERGWRAWLVDLAAGAAWAAADGRSTGPRSLFVVGGVFEDDGRTHPAGTFVHYPAGSVPTLRSTTGCRLLVFDPEG